MRPTNHTLAIHSKRGREGKKLNNVYKHLLNPEVYEKAYSEIYANQGATTKGTGEETLDGMSRKRIDMIIEAVRLEQYRWRPVRRTYIPKGDGRLRPLGIPSGDDKLLQAAMKNLLEAYYEPTFSERSHGFRPQKGCHTALVQVAQKHRDTNWFIEGDIKGCFDNIDHETLLGIMGEKIEDGRLIGLTRKLLKTGTMEDWTTKYTYSGIPQGGTISPLLTNVYLDVFDKWVEKELLPKHNRSLNPIPSRGRRKNPLYSTLSSRMSKAKKRGDIETYKLNRKLRENVPSVITDDEGFRKLEYVRYADDFLLSFAGPKSEAMEIKEEIRKFLKDKLKLEMSEEKTLITHARTKRAKFLGYEVSLFQNNQKKVLNGKMRFSIPKKVITEAMRKYTKKGKPIHRGSLQMETDLEIIWTYQSEYRGLVQYYQMAHNIDTLTQVRWVCQNSLLKTLAAKYRTSTGKIKKKYGTTVEINGFRYKVIEARFERKGKNPIIARFGGIPLARNPIPAKITDTKRKSFGRTRSEITERLKAENCEMCGKEGMVEMHHVRKLKDVNKPGRKNKPAWVHRMAAIRRKTLACCPECHNGIHAGKHLPIWDTWKKTLESRVR